MERDYVESKMIRSYGFDSLTSTLEVEFNNGAIWQYFDVPENLYYEMKASSSCGKFFNANIRDHYSESRIG
ncbi:KTSC domain-containing protein [Flavobacterium sp.]|uniref:KTSC domain-containing protein n=1 Tax=Flavobacterium sp. TaxID=239 RepID=UPI00261CFD57|nr:KTSC domain-containing protein [Flavobacterium sp.]